MNLTERVRTEDRLASEPVFISYATADRKQALSVCEAIERRGARCWISSRDVGPGENYQEAIVRAIRTARAMVLVFSHAANNSDEIKKELSLASKRRLPVLALRIEDVEPSDAFAYELSTRQWLDASDGWDSALDTLVENLAPATSAGPVAHTNSPRPSRKRGKASFTRGRLALAGTALAAILAGGAIWWASRSSGDSGHQVQVRLADFQRLSPGLPDTISAAVQDELASAFAEDGVITASMGTAKNPHGYTLGGTLRAEEGMVRAIARVTSDDTGSTIWSYAFEYPATSPARIPHWFAANSAAVLKCALSAASTYPRRLSEKTLSLAFKVCNASSGAEALEAARRVVQATPDFSAGWSALAAAALRYSQPAESERESLRKEAWDATEKAISLDPNNAQAFVVQSIWLPHHELVRRESLLKKAIAARSLPPGSDHFFYGWFLWEVGKIRDAGQQLHRASIENPLDVDTRVSLAETLLLQGYSEADADEQYRAAADTVPDPEFLALQKLWAAPITQDYAQALALLSSGRLPSLPPAMKDALIGACKAVLSGDAAAKRQAAAKLEALPQDLKNYLTVLMLGALGANREALRQMQMWDAQGRMVRARLFLWYPSMAGVIRDPAFAASAEQMGLMRYWRSTHSKPDVCKTGNPPPFCTNI